jgi:hypothetical protein
MYAHEKSLPPHELSYFQLFNFCQLNLFHENGICKSSPKKVLGSFFLCLVPQPWIDPQITLTYARLLVKWDDNYAQFMSKMLLKTFSFYFISSLSFTWSQTIISVPKLAWLKFCLINLVIVGSQMLFDQTMTIKILYTLPHKSMKGGTKWTIELANHWKSHILVIERRELESHSWNNWWDCRSKGIFC